MGTKRNTQQNQMINQHATWELHRVHPHCGCNLFAPADKLNFQIFLEIGN